VKENLRPQSKTYPNYDETLPLELITKKEVARRLRVSERRIELDSSFPTIRWGRRTVRYDWSEIVEYLKTQDLKSLK
jgi:hypothetical protein